MLSDINYLAVIVAAAAGFGVGFLYYLPMPPFLGKLWSDTVKEYTKLSDTDLAPTPLMPLLWMVTAVVNAFGLALLIEAAHTRELIDGIGMGLVVWACFGLTFSSWAVIFAKQPVRLWLINNGAFLIMQVVMAVILTVW
jgi:hypothetical protein